MKRLSLVELHRSGLKKNLMGKIKGGADIKCLCSYNNPLVSTRETGGGATLCICQDNPVSNGVQHRPISE